MTRIRKTLLWLLIINLGLAAGAALYESRIVFDQWLLLSPFGDGYIWDAEAARSADVGLRFWVFVSTVPLTLLALASFAAAWGADADVRRWWLATTTVLIAERVFTFGYFIPTMIWLFSSEASQTEAVATALQWKNLNYVRHLLVFVAWIGAIKTLTLVYGAGGFQARLRAA